MRDVLYEQMLQNPSVTWFMNSSLNYVIFYEQPCTWLMNSPLTQNVISCILWKSGTPYQPVMTSHTLSRRTGPTVKFEFTYGVSFFPKVYETASMHNNRTAHKSTYTCAESKYGYPLKISYFRAFSLMRIPTNEVFSKLWKNGTPYRKK